MRIRRRLHAILWGAVASAAPIVARGAERPVDVRWSAPPGCPPKDEFVESLSNPDQSVSTLPPLRISVTITKKSGLYSLEVTTPAMGARSFEGTTCDEVLGAAALVLSLHLGNELLAPESDTETETTPASPVQAPIEPEFDFSEPSKKRKPASPPRVNLGAAFTIDLGSLSNALVGTEAAVGSDFGPLRLEAAGAIFLPASPTIHGRATSGSATYGQARLSVHAFDSARIAVRLRTALNYTYAAVETTDDGPVRSDSSKWLGIAFGAAAESWVTPAFAVTFGFDAVAPFERPRLLDLPAEDQGSLAKPVVYRGFLGTRFLFF